MSHVFQAQDVTWQCGECSPMLVVPAARPTLHFPAIENIRASAVDVLPGHLQRKGNSGVMAKCLFPSGFSELTSLCKRMTTIWWMALKIARIHSAAGGILLWAVCFVLCAIVPVISLLGTQRPCTRWCTVGICNWHFQKRALLVVLWKLVGI